MFGNFLRERLEGGSPQKNVEVPVLKPGIQSFFLALQGAERFGLRDPQAEINGMLDHVHSVLRDQQAECLKIIPVSGVKGGFLGLLVIARKEGSNADTNVSMNQLPEGVSYIAIMSVKANRFGLKNGVPNELSGLLNEQIEQLPPNATIKELIAIPSSTGTTIGLILTVEASDSAR